KLSEIPAAKETVGEPKEQARASPGEESQVRAADVCQHPLGKSRDQDEPVHAVWVSEGEAQRQARSHRVPDESGARNVYGIEKATEPLHIDCRGVGDAGAIGKSLTDHVWNKQSQPPAKRLDLMLPVPDGAGVAVQLDGRGVVTMQDVS